ncbi:MAG: UMP kinase [Candidatus Caldarchaeum sp.]
MNVVLKLGGHVIFTDPIDVSLMKHYASLLSEVFDGGRWVVVVGGGENARRYIETARILGLDETSCDEAAVKLTRLHAYLFARVLGNRACQTIPETADQIRSLSDMGKIVVSGGLQPGQSTMAVSVLAASVVGAERIVVATNVDGIYSEDPKKNSGAKLIPKMRFEELAALSRNVSQKAGEYQVVDAVGMAMLLRARIPLYYVNGRKLDQVHEALLGRGAGTIVSD